MTKNSYEYDIETGKWIKVSLPNNHPSVAIAKWIEQTYEKDDYHHTIYKIKPQGK